MDVFPTGGASSRAAPLNANILSRDAVAGEFGNGVLPAHGRVSQNSHRKQLSDAMHALVFILQCAADFIALWTAIALAGLFSQLISKYVLHMPYLAFGDSDYRYRMQLWLYLTVGLCAWFGMTGAYTHRRSLLNDVKYIVTALFVMLMIDGFIEFASKMQFSRLWVVLVWPTAILLIPLARIAVRRVLTALGLWRVGVAVLGEGGHFGSVTHLFERHNYVGYYMAYHSKFALEPEIPLSLYAERLAADVRLRGGEMVFLMPSASEMPGLDRIVDALNLNLIPYVLIPPLQRLPYAGLSVQAVLNSDAIMLTFRNGLMSPVRQLVKRIFDVVTSAILLVFLAPLFALISVLVASTPGPIFYGHRRVGRDNKSFRCLKFRTMVINSDQVLTDLVASDPEAALEWRKNFKLANDPRITKVGKFLRKTSLDELPQLVNVLFGEMSLVGPRPVVADELRRYYGEDVFYYLLVRPGITGLWQVSGRSQTTYARRVFLDTWYVRNWSLWTDFAILFNTIPSVLFGDGAH